MPAPNERPTERAGIAVTQLIKLAGIAVVLHEIFLEPSPRTSGIALAAFMLAGATSFESLLRALLKNGNGNGNGTNGK